MTEATPPAPEVTISPRKVGRVRLLWTLAYIIVPAIALAGIEAWMRGTVYVQTWDYNTLKQTRGQMHYDYLFAGSSRTQLGVDENAFAEEVARLGGPANQSAINLSAGYCRVMYHYFGLRTMLRDDPTCLRGTTVFIECPSGMGEYLLWTDPWTYTRAERVLFPGMIASDLPKLWLAHTPLEYKLDMTVRFLTYNYKSYAMRGILRAEFFRVGREAAARELVKLGADDTPPPLPADAPKFRTGASVDPKVAKNAPMYFKEFYEQEKKIIERHWRSWDISVHDDLVKLIHNAGGKVVFIDMPQPSIFDPMYKWEGRDEDRRLFNETVTKRWNSFVIHSAVKFPDEAYPDRFHLDGPSAEIYSRALAEDYVRKLNAATEAGSTNRHIAE
ncbi:hypothetical protein IT570_01190 [Candidatus Sumerlaeota bacterium]|nr:hypothetical protein [Candidatus Sumerlaeota bacterium]